MASTADLEAAFEDAVTKLKNAQLDWITAKSDESTDEEVSLSESTEQGDIEDFTQNEESLDQTVPGGQSTEHELRPVWFVPNIFQLRPILGYSTNEQANLDAGYSTCSDHEKTADQFHTNTEVDESQGTTTLRPLEGQYSPYFNMYYGSDGQVYGCAPKLAVGGEVTEHDGETVEDLETKSAEAFGEVEALDEVGSGRETVEEAYETDEGNELYEEVAGEVPDVVYTEEDEEEGEEGDEYYDYEDVEGREVEEKLDTVEDIEALVAYPEQEYEEQDAEYYYDDCAVEYSEGGEEDIAYAVCDEVAGEVDEDEDNLYECEADADLHEVHEGVEAYADYEGEELDEEDAEDEDAEEAQYYDEACEDEYEEAYEEGEYDAEAVQAGQEQEQEYEEVPKEVFYVEKDQTKDHVLDNYLHPTSKPTPLGQTPVGAVKPGTSGHAPADAQTSEQKRAYSFYKTDEQEQDADAEQCAEYPNGYVDAYGNPCLYNHAQVPVDGYY